MVALCCFLLKSTLSSFVWLTFLRRCFSWPQTFFM